MKKYGRVIVFIGLLLHFAVIGFVLINPRDAGANIGAGLLMLAAMIVLAAGLILTAVSLKGTKRLAVLVILAMYIGGLCLLWVYGEQRANHTYQSLQAGRKDAYKALPYTVRVPSTITTYESPQSRAPLLKDQIIGFAFKDASVSYFFTQYPIDPTYTDGRVCYNPHQFFADFKADDCNLASAANAAEKIYYAPTKTGDRAAYVQFGDSVVAVYGATLSQETAVNLLSNLQAISYDRAYQLGIFY